jgi:RNA polymerase-binding transcription factor DksA
VELRRTHIDRMTWGNSHATRQALADIETALYRMHTGRYGACLYCGREIPIEELRAHPAADSCRTCAVAS